MEDADEILFLDDYNDAQELMVTQREGRGSFSSGQCGTAAEKWNAQLFPKETLQSVPETTASHEDILKIPERDHSADILYAPERGSRGRILEAPDIESQDCVSTPSVLSPPICRHNDSDSESDGSGSSLFRSQCTFTPTRTARRHSHATSSLKAPSIELHKDSSDSSSGPVPRFNLNQIFERRRRRRKRREGKCEAKKICRTFLKPSLQPSEAIPLPRRQRRWKDETSTFPFLDKKDLPLKMIFTHEQGSLWGFLHQMKKLKYERHLQASLQNLNVSNESEDEHEDSRGYSYLDDDGPISPITELNEDQHCDDEDPPEKYDAKIVDNSCFILNWNPPAKKKQSKKKKKIQKPLRQDELDQEVAAMEGGDDEDL